MRVFRAGFFLAAAIAVVTATSPPPQQQHVFQSLDDAATRLLGIMADMPTHVSMHARYSSAMEQLSPLDRRQITAEIDADQSTTLTAARPECPIRVPEFQCAPPSTASPRDLDAQLPRLQDIRLLAAMGDSISAGLFIQGSRATVFRHVRGLSTEDRNLVFTVGKDDLTLGTLLRHYSPDIGGLGWDRTPSNTVPQNLSAHEFNFARLSMSSDELIEQAQVLIERLRSDAYLPLRSEWKMINIFVGGINLCNICNSKYVTKDGVHRGTPEYHAASLDRLLDYLSTHIPRDAQGRQYVFINMMTLFSSVSPIYEAGKDTFWCRKVQQFGDFCGCLYTNDTTRGWMDASAKLYNDALTRVVRKWQSRSDGNRFRVSLVRTMEEMELSDLGMPFITPTDWYFQFIIDFSFHPNLCFNRLAAYKMWEALTTGENRVDLGWHRRPLSWNCFAYENITLKELL